MSLTGDKKRRRLRRLKRGEFLTRAGDVAPHVGARFRETHQALLPSLRSYDIASYLGITPVSLSRLRARTAASRSLRRPRAESENTAARSNRRASTAPLR
jgi:hypothetical protein